MDHSPFPCPGVGGTQDQPTTPAQTLKLRSKRRPCHSPSLLPQTRAMFLIGSVFLPLQQLVDVGQNPLLLNDPRTPTHVPTTNLSQTSKDRDTLSNLSDKTICDHLAHKGAGWPPVHAFENVFLPTTRSPMETTSSTPRTVPR